MEKPISRQKLSMHPGLEWGTVTGWKSLQLKHWEERGSQVYPLCFPLSCYTSHDISPGLLAGRKLCSTMFLLPVIQRPILSITTNYSGKVSMNSFIASWLSKHQPYSLEWCEINQSPPLA